MDTHKTLVLIQSSDLQEASDQLELMIKGLPQPVNVDVFLNEAYNLSIGSLCQTDYGVLIQYRSKKTCAVSLMSAIDTLLQLSVDDLSGKEDKLILSIQSPDFFLASLLDWQGDYQERILRDLILRHGDNHRLEIPYGGVSLALLSDSPYPWINVQSVHIDEHDYLIFDGITEGETTVSLGGGDMCPNAAYYVISHWYECYEIESPQELDHQVFNSLKKASDIAAMSSDERLAYRVHLAQLRSEEDILADKYQEGYELGIEQGIEQGEKRGIQKVALELLRNGASFAFVADNTGLSVQELKQLYTHL